MSETATFAPVRSATAPVVTTSISAAADAVRTVEDAPSINIFVGSINEPPETSIFTSIASLAAEKLTRALSAPTSPPTFPPAAVKMIELEMRPVVDGSPSSKILRPALTVTVSFKD